MPAPSDFKPMSTFDPTQRAILHNRNDDSIYTWTGEYANDFLRYYIVRQDGSIEWNDKVFDGWGDVLGG